LAAIEGGTMSQENGFSAGVWSAGVRYAPAAVIG